MECGTNKWGLLSSYFNEEFDSLNELLEYIVDCGVCPNQEVTKNGEGIGEDAIEFIVP
tara:strand:+ start:265 stop:438 length:174 start_codon:yes stop_codon:yes gene_type:complete